MYLEDVANGMNVSTCNLFRFFHRCYLLLPIEASAVNLSVNISLLAPLSLIIESSSIVPHPLPLSKWLDKKNLVSSQICLFAYLHGNINTNDETSHITSNAKKRSLKISDHFFKQNGKPSLSGE